MVEQDEFTGFFDEVKKKTQENFSDYEPPYEVEGRHKKVQKHVENGHSIPVVMQEGGENIIVTQEMIDAGWTYEKYKQQNPNPDALPNTASLVLLLVVAGIALWVIWKK